MQHLTCLHTVLRDAAPLLPQKHITPASSTSQLSHPSCSIWWPFDPPRLLHIQVLPCCFSQAHRDLWRMWPASRLEFWWVPSSLSRERGKRNARTSITYDTIDGVWEKPHVFIDRSYHQSSLLRICNTFLHVRIPICSRMHPSAPTAGGVGHTLRKGPCCALSSC